MIFAKRVNLLSDPSAAEALVLAGKKSLISFGGGIPDPDVLPVRWVNSVIRGIIKSTGTKVLQYGPTAGDRSLRAEIADQLSGKWKRQIDPDEVLITSGAQQAIDLLGKTFLNKGDRILVEDPTYFVAVSAFDSYEVKYHTVRLLPDGPDITQLADILSRRRQNHSFAYVIPTYHNPTGYCWSYEKRKQVLEISRRYNVLIVEDDPYGELYFGNPPPPNLKAGDTAGTVIYVGSFSKVLSPGLRVGYIVAERKIVEKLILVKQSMDLNTSSLSQEIIRMLIRDTVSYRHHLQMIRRHYAEKSVIMDEFLRGYCSGLTVWTKPEGGLFMWLKISGIRSADLAKTAADCGVSVMPGYPFYAGIKNHHTIRLTYATAKKSDIQKGIRILRDALAHGPL